MSCKVDGDEDETPQIPLTHPSQQREVTEECFETDDSVLHEGPLNEKAEVCVRIWNMIMKQR